MEWASPCALGSGSTRWPQWRRVWRASAWRVNFAGARYAAWRTSPGGRYAMGRTPRYDRDMQPDERLERGCSCRMTSSDRFEVGRWRFEGKP